MPGTHCRCRALASGGHRERAARFALGEGERATTRFCTAGDVVHVPSLTVHGFETGDDPLVVLYLWQGGDLRAKSRFAG